MRSLFYFLVSPKEERYNNSKKIENFNFIMNTSIEDAKDVSRVGVVEEIPINYKGLIKKGDEVIVHHNIFREYYDIKGNIKDSKSYFMDNIHLVFEDSIYLYNKNDWTCNLDFIFIKPIEKYNSIKYKNEETYLTGEVFYPNGSFKKGDLISFSPESEYEIKVEGERLYRMKLSDICFKL